MHSSFVEPHNIEHDGRDGDGDSDTDSCASSTMNSTAGSQCSQKSLDGDESEPRHAARFERKLYRLEHADQPNDHGVPYSILRYASTPQRHSRIKLASQHLEAEGHSTDGNEHGKNHNEKGGQGGTHGEVVASGATTHTNDDSKNDNDDETTSKEDDDEMPS